MTRLYCLFVWQDVEPELSAPFATEDERRAAAQAYRREHGNDHGIYRIDQTADGKLTVDTFTDNELEAPAPKLCPACEAWADGGRTLTEEQWHAADDALCVPCRVAGPDKGTK